MGVDQYEIKPVWFERIEQTDGVRYMLDLFVTARSRKTRRYYTRVFEPEAKGIDGMVHNWSGEREVLFAHPPIGLAGPCWQCGGNHSGHAGMERQMVVQAAGVPPTSGGRVVDTARGGMAAGRVHSGSGADVGYAGGPLGKLRLAEELAVVLQPSTRRQVFGKVQAAATRAGSRMDADELVSAIRVEAGQAVSITGISRLWLHTAE